MLRRLTPRLAMFSRHPQVRRDARRAPFIALGQFALVAAAAVAVGFAITQFAN